MKYTQEMILRSPSGFAMPFEEPDKDVEVTLGYGKQKYEESGKEFFHHGVNFNAPWKLLFALATGRVVGVGQDLTNGTYQIIRYGDYDVMYGQLSNIFAHYGEHVKAGQEVATSAYFLHMEVRYKDEELDPIEFLTMIYGNIKTMQRQKQKEQPFQIPEGFHTSYDSQSQEIETLMLRFLPVYLRDLQTGQYALSQKVEQSLRATLLAASRRGYFFESIPSMENPMGLGKRSLPLAEKIQNILIDDFLSYLALCHSTYLSSWSEETKKKFLMRLHLKAY